MILYKNVYFKLNYHRHGDREWLIKLITSKKVLITKEISINVPVRTTIVRNKAWIIGKGNVQFSKAGTVIYK